MPGFRESDHEVTATSRSCPVALPGIRYVAQDIGEDRADYYELFGRPELVIHLAWEGLSNYGTLSHFEKHLFADYRFLKQMVEAGLRDLTVVGTCFEYGCREGRLTEETPQCPCTPYGIAKHASHLFLEELRKTIPFDLKWIRLFYLYGDGQRAQSVLGQLDAALARGERVFNMSGGEQLRDYLPVEEVARRIVDIAMQKRVQGAINLCSGKPLSVRRLVEEHLRRRGKSMELNLGYYPYTDYEPHAFWGDTEKLRQVESIQKH